MALQLKKDLQFRDYFRIISDHKYQIFITVVCFMLPTLYFISQKPAFYKAYSQLAMEQNERSYFLVNQSQNTKTIGYYTGLFTGRAFQQKLLNSLDTSRIPGKNIRRKQDFLAGIVKISAGNFSSFIKISATVESPELAFDIVRIATDSLIVFCKRVENQESEQTLKVIKEQIFQTTEKYNETTMVKNKNNQNQTQGDINGLKALEHAFDKMLVDYELENAELQAKKTYFNSLNQKIKINNPGMQEERKILMKDLDKLNAERKKKIQLGIPILPEDSLLIKIKQVQKEMALLSRGNKNKIQDIAVYKEWKESKKALEKIKNDMQFKKNKIKAFQQAISDYKKNHPNILEHELENNRLEELISRHTATHKRLTEKLEDEVIKMQSQTGGLKIVDPAFLPVEPVKTKDFVFYVISFLVGLTFGVIIALFRDFMDNTIKTPDDVEKRLALTLMGSIPHIVIKKSDLRIKRTVTDKHGATLSQQYPELILKGGKDEGLVAEAYRSLRTNILFASPDKELKTFLITSCGPHEGKSLTSANTALAFAQQGEPTLLVDSDLRRPICHHLFQINRGPGIGDLVNGSVEIEDTLQTVSNTSLKIIAAGTFIPNAAEVLGSNKFMTIIEKLKERFKYILFDTPPIMAVTDACVLASKVDGVVLVTRAEITSLDVAERSLQALLRVKANIFGCVLNDINLTKNNGYYGYYKNYYQYYHTTKD